MTVNNFLDMLFCDETIVDVYDFNTNNTIFHGTVNEVRDKYGEHEFDSFDVDENHLCVNIWEEE